MIPIDDENINANEMDQDEGKMNNGTLGGNFERVEPIVPATQNEDNSEKTPSKIEGENA